MLSDGVGIAHIEIGAQLLLLHPGNVSEVAHDILDPGVERVGDGVYLEAVAGGDNHRLAQRARRHHGPASVILHGLVHAQLFQQRHRRRLMRHAHDEHTHAQPSSFASSLWMT